MDIKPSYPKPQLYTYIFVQLKEIAKEHGYNLLIHGSMNRDCDLVAVPWTDNPSDELTLINTISKHLTGRTFKNAEHYKHSRLPGGRSSYVIDLNRGGYKRTPEGDIADPIEFTPDPQFYLDICVTPLIREDEVIYRP